MTKKKGFFREGPLPSGVEPIACVNHLASCVNSNKSCDWISRYEIAQLPWGQLDEDGEQIEVRFMIRSIPGISADLNCPVQPEEF
jgi:hypothetical protein